MVEEKTFDFTKVPGQSRNKNITISKQKPLISIITAYYNSKDYIDQTATSIFNQTFPHWEWIIVNDGSTEKQTNEVLSKLENLDSRIKVLNVKNGGPAKARMHGVKMATADYIFIMDSDDAIDPTFLECGYFSLITNPDAAWAYTNLVNFGQEEYLANKYFTSMIEKRENVICGNSIIRKDAFLEVGGYDTEGNVYHEDWQLWLKLLAKGYYPIRMNFYGFWYRRRQGVLNSVNIDRKKNQEAKKQISKLTKKIKNNTSGIQFPVSDTFTYKEYPYLFSSSLNKPIFKEKNKKNLLFIVPWFTVGGADRFNLDLLSNLDPEKYHITIVTTEIAPYIWRQKAESFAEFFDLSTFLRRKDWAAFIGHLISTRQIDLVFLSNSMYGYYVVPWLKTQFPSVIFVDYLHAEDFSWRDGGYPRDSIAISKYLDRTYTCTTHLQDVMIQKMNRKNEKMKTVYIGVDDQKFKPNVDCEHTFDFSLYQDKKKVLFPCRIYELKRPIFMLRVLQSICRERDDVVFFIVGDGPELEETKQKAKEWNLEKSTIFFGMQNNIIPFYQEADVTLICSLTEGLALTAYESLAMGVPVVTSDVGGQKELVNDKCGKVIKTYQNVKEDLYNRNYSEEEIEEYKTAILSILDSADYKQMHKYCRNRIEKSFSIQNMAREMDHEFTGLIESGSSVDMSVLNDADFTSNYLLLYLQLYIRHVYKEEENNTWKGKLKKSIKRVKEWLWKFWIWRLFIKVCQKIGLVTLKNKMIRKNKDENRNKKI